jgi:thiamine transport system permease protein
MDQRKALKLAAAVTVVSFSAFTWFFPLLLIFSQGIYGLFSDGVLRAVRFTLFQSSLSVLGSLLIGFPLGMLCAHSRFAQKILSFPPLVPGLITAMALVSVLRGSFLAYTVWAVILAHTLLNAPWIAVRLSEASRWVSEDEINSARLLGANRFQAWRTVVWPVWIRPLALAIVQVWIWCALSFSLVLLLGGGPPSETLETAIYSRIRYGTLDLKGAASCALWQLLIVGLPTVLMLRLRDGNPGSGGQSESSPTWLRAVANGVAFVFILPFLPLLSGLVKNPTQFSETPPWVVSGLLALTVCASSLVLSTLTLWCSDRGSKSAQLLRWAFVLPQGLSPLLLGLGFWLLYAEWADFSRGSLTAMIFLQTAGFSPILFRILQSLETRMDHASLETAQTLGASPLCAFFTVEWPKWKSPLFQGLVLLFVFSLGEVATVSLFAGNRVQTLSTWILNLGARYQFEEARKVALFILLVTWGLLTLRTPSRRLEC